MARWRSGNAAVCKTAIAPVRFRHAPHESFLMSKVNSRSSVSSEIRSSRRRVNNEELSLEVRLGGPIIGEVSEWTNELVLKTSVAATSPWVRIPPSPPSLAEASYGGHSPPK